MTAMRLIGLPTHAALEMLAGLALGAAPFVLGLSTAATFVGVVVGVLLVGLALWSTDTETINVSAHRAADQGISLGLAVAGLVLAGAGDLSAAALFGVAAFAHLTLIAVTHYTAR